MQRTTMLCEVFVKRFETRYRRYRRAAVEPGGGRQAVGMSGHISAGCSYERPRLSAGLVTLRCRGVSGEHGTPARHTIAHAIEYQLYCGSAGALTTEDVQRARDPRGIDLDRAFAELRPAMLALAYRSRLASQSSADERGWPDAVNVGTVQAFSAYLTDFPARSCVRAHSPRSSPEGDACRSACATRQMILQASDTTN
jgi:hypothetical protein